MGGLRRAGGVERGADAVLGLRRRRRRSRSESGRNARQPRSAPIARCVGALERLRIRNRLQTALRRRRPRPERRVGRGRASLWTSTCSTWCFGKALSMVRAALSRLADAALSGVLGLRPDGAADREREEHEHRAIPRSPSCDAGRSSGPSERPGSWFLLRVRPSLPSTGRQANLHPRRWEARPRQNGDSGGYSSVCSTWRSRRTRGRRPP